ncbi:MAG: hypothetical protein ACQPRH_04195 [Solitalea-like symbiont of Tyrophagus putrescentiae]
MKNLTKYLLLLSILSLFGYSVSAQNQGTKITKTTSKIGTPEYLLVKRGFKIFKLGTPIEQYKKYVVLGYYNLESGVKMYKILTGMNPQFASIGDSIEINDVVLEVYDGLISAISVFVEPKYKDALLRSLQAAYGPGNKPNKYIEKYRWHASNKKNNIYLTYTDSYERGGALNGNAWAMFYDSNLAAKQEQDEKNQAKQTVKDL